MARALVGPAGPLWASWALVGRALVGLPVSVWAPLGPCGRPWALVGAPWPLWAEPLWATWALMGRAIVGPLWALVGRAIVGPPGPWWAGPLWAPLGSYGPRHRNSLLGLTLETKFVPPQYIFSRLKYEVR